MSEPKAKAIFRGAMPAIDADEILIVMCGKQNSPNGIAISANLASASDLEKILTQVAQTLKPS